MDIFARMHALPIRRKLQLILLATSVLGLLLAGGAFLFGERLLLRDSLRQDLTALARLVANRSEAALVFDDRRLAGENLEALQVKPSVTRAFILDERGQVFASYPAIDRELPPSLAALTAPAQRFDSGRLLVAEPVLLEGRQVGSVLIQADLRDLDEAWRRNLSISALILAGAALATLFLSSRLQRLVSDPILELTRAAREVARNSDTSVRVGIRSGDELGELGRTFNAMLSTIEGQNRQLQEANQGLERRVAERTRELLKAREAAESADRLKSAFLASMSHELRTPLNSIIGFTGILLQELVGPLNPEQHKQLGIVRASSNHLLDLINDVLDISKIEAGQLQVAREPMDPRAVADRTLQSVQPLARRKGLDLEGDLADDLPGILSDPRRVQQILMNLLSNAIKFTEKGSVRLRVLAEGPMVRFEVADTGIGISPEELSRLFVPFSQIDTGLTRKYDGTGLGLSISKRLAELLGGAIQVESAPGRGSTFTVLLPRPEATP